MHGVSDHCKGLTKNIGLIEQAAPVRPDMPVHAAITFTPEIDQFDVVSLDSVSWVFGKASDAFDFPFGNA